MVAWHAAEGVLRLEDRIGDELAGVLVLEPVEHPLPVLPGRDDARQTQLGEMLRHCRRRLVDDVREVIHRELFDVAQGQDDPNASGVGQHREHLDRQFDELGYRGSGRIPAYLHPYADSCTSRGDGRQE